VRASSSKPSYLARGTTLPNSAHLVRYCSAISLRAYSSTISAQVQNWRTAFFLQVANRALSAVSAANA
jgi:hypothetical protein